MDEPTTETPAPTQTEFDNQAQARAASAVGQVISERYRVDDLLAMGGMGAVYRGTHLLLKKRIAIKILHPGTENLPELVTRFEREAIAGAHVQHPNVAAATDFGTLDDGSYFLVLEYVKGRTLHHTIKSGGALAPDRAVKIARQLASALAKTHAIGIVHRDVKPRNIMLVEGEGDVAKLIDFGLAKVPVAVFSAAADRLSRVSMGHGSGLSLRSPSVAERLTVEGTIFGTIAYLAPEAALGMDAVDERSDLYALGIVLYEMLAGKHPFEGIDATELFKQQRFAVPPPIAERAPGTAVPAAIEAVVMRLLDKAPDLRYPSGEALIEALDAALIEAPAAPVVEPWSADPSFGATGPTLTAPGPAARPGPAERYRVILGGVLFFALGVAGMLVFARSRKAEGGGAGSVVSVAASTSTSTSASVSASTSVSASASASEAPSARVALADPALDLLVLRAGLIKSARVHDWGRGGEALLGLIDRDPESLRRSDLAVAAREVTAALERENGAEKLFAGLTRGPGTEGLDVLYDLVQAKGGSNAAVRAAEILRQEEVLSRATPELRAAFRLRDASCVDKIPLFDLAAKDGDGRALVVMETQGRACFKKSKELDAAVKELKERLLRGSAPR